MIQDIQQNLDRAEAPPNRHNAIMLQSDLHQQALKIREYGNLRQELEPCQCCGLRIPNGNKISLKSPLESIAYLGVSFPMFFRTINMILYFLSIMLPIVLACIIINFTNDTPNYMVIPSDINSDLILTQMILHLLALVVLMVLFPIIIWNERGKIVNLLSQSKSATDFTVMIVGLPQRYSHDALRRHMEHLFEYRNTPTAAIVPTYDINGFSKLDKELRKLKERLYLFQGRYVIERKCCRRAEYLDPELCRYDIQQCEEEQIKMIRTFDNTNRGPVAFVSFKSFNDAKEILEDFELSIYQLFWEWIKKRHQETKHRFNGHFLQFRRPPHPSDLNWDNLSINFKTKLKSRLLTYAVSALILGFGMFLLYVLREYQHTEERSTLTLLPSFLILVINTILEICMASITEYELHSSYTNYKVSLARKLIVLMFMNTAVIPTVVNSYIVNEKDEWFEPGGLCSDVYSIIMINAICPPLFYLYILNPLYVKFLVQSFLFKRKVLKGAQVTQEQANKNFTPIEFDLAERYAQIIKTVYVGVFFCPLVPLSIVFSMGGVLLEYGVTKYMLNKHPVPRVHNERLVLEMFEWLRYSICVYAIGVAFFYFEIDGNTSDNYSWDSVVIIALITAISGIVYLLIPINHFLNKNLYKDLKDEMNAQLNEQTNTLQEIDHNQIEQQNSYKVFRLTLEIDFERANPVIRDQALRRFEEDSKREEGNIPEIDDGPREWIADPNSLIANMNSYNSIQYIASVPLALPQYQPNLNTIGNQV